MDIVSRRVNRIAIEQLVPFPLVEQNTDASEIWGQKCQFNAGQFYLISGVSGKGKSTILHILYGLRKDYHGSVEVDDAELSKMAPGELQLIRSQCVSMLFQDLRLFPELTARENIFLLPKLDEKAVLEMESMASDFGVLSFLDKKTETLSYGQRQRVAMIRSMMQPFQFLLLDEPFSHLDDGNVSLAREIIVEQCRRRRAGLIMVSLGGSYGFEYDQVYQL